MAALSFDPITLLNFSNIADELLARTPRQPQAGERRKKTAEGIPKDAVTGMCKSKWVGCNEVGNNACTPRAGWQDLTIKSHGHCRVAWEEIERIVMISFDKSIGALACGLVVFLSGCDKPKIFSPEPVETRVEEPAKEPAKGSSYVQLAEKGEGSFLVKDGKPFVSLGISVVEPTCPNAGRKLIAKK
ncbi:MAG: hypothetical protein NTZ01_08095 [Verrucomicrobia bacterium]|nr:hypothetical protein [Verrucomicrobiota bacterium]